MNTNISNIIIAGIEIEFSTPLCVKSGDYSVLSDSIVVKDTNSFPYIPGTSLAGLIRHNLKLQKEDDEFIFGKIDGSRIIFTNANLVYGEKLVVDGIMDNIENNAILCFYKNLNTRQHVSINHSGVAKKNAKFDEEIVYSGSRFYFEIEIFTNSNEEFELSLNTFYSIISLLKQPNIRLGSGSRKGLGEFIVTRSNLASIDLSNLEMLNLYANKSSSLNDFEWWKNIPEYSLLPIKDIISDHEWIKKTYKLVPEDFFLIGSGYGTKDTDKGPVKEDKLIWKEGKPEILKDCLLIPASSIKGSISHRLAYNYNEITRVFADEIDKTNLSHYTCENNTAVKYVFGTSGSKPEEAKRGLIIPSDIIENIEYLEKIQNHVAIDEFTSGSIKGGLFSESLIFTENEFLFNLQFHNSLFDGEKTPKDVKEALEKTLKDFEDGLIPIGSGNGKGFGFFKVDVV